MSGFSPPKGIRCFSTTGAPDYFKRILLYGLQSPEEDSLFFYVYHVGDDGDHEVGFQSPEGDSLFFYPQGSGAVDAAYRVSVPRRGFVVFLPEGIYKAYFRYQASFQSPEGDSLFFYKRLRKSSPRSSAESVSVPRRGFVVFLRVALEAGEINNLLRFSPPKGIRCFSTV